MKKRNFANKKEIGQDKDKTDTIPTHNPHFPRAFLRAPVQGSYFPWQSEEDTAQSPSLSPAREENPISVSPNIQRDKWQEPASQLPIQEKVYASGGTKEELASESALVECAEELAIPVGEPIPKDNEQPDVSTEQMDEEDDEESFRLTLSDQTRVLESESDSEEASADLSVADNAETLDEPDTSGVSTGLVIGLVSFVLTSTYIKQQRE